MILFFKIKENNIPVSNLGGLAFIFHYHIKFEL